MQQCSYTRLSFMNVESDLSP